jgi:dimeric dUTPase (all-alpha-NTP-PPase superfamily)
MNLTKLFDMQRTLDARIVEQHGLQGQDLLPQKILALQVELGECANEWRGFKFWSSRQTPTEPKFNWKPNEDGSNLEWNPEYGYESHPLLEEYIDCLHFILSIGLDLDIDIYAFGIVAVTSDSVIESFSSVFDAITLFSEDFDDWEYEQMFDRFAGLGKMLGFSTETIEEAYMTKNKINHERQDTNY